jgi:hypothetical protein
MTSGRPEIDVAWWLRFSPLAITMRRDAARVPSESTCDESRAFFSERVEKILRAARRPDKGALSIRSDMEVE